MQSGKMGKTIKKKAKGKTTRKTQLLVKAHPCTRDGNRLGISAVFEAGWPAQEPSLVRTRVSRAATAWGQLCVLSFTQQFTYSSPT